MTVDTTSVVVLVMASTVVADTIFKEAATGAEAVINIRTPVMKAAFPFPAREKMCQLLLFSMKGKVDGPGSQASEKDT